MSLQHENNRLKKDLQKQSNKASHLSKKVKSLTSELEESKKENQKLVSRQTKIMREMATLDANLTKQMPPEIMKQQTIQSKLMVIQQLETQRGNLVKKVKNQNQMMKENQEKENQIRHLT